MSKHTRRDEVLRERFFDAVYRRHIVEVVRLLNKGVNPNFIAPPLGMTPLQILAGRDDTLLGYRLMQAPGIDLNMKGSLSMTPLHVACKYKCKKFVHMLLQAGADPDVRDRNGKTALHHAVQNESLSIVYCLVKNKANINVMDHFENTPLSISLLDVRNILIAKFLSTEKLDLAVENEKTTLHVFFECVLACHELNDIQYVLFLLDLGIDVNMTDKWSGKNCLHFVAITGYLELAVVLVKQGADVSAVDNFHRNPVKVAIEHGNMEVADFLQKGYRPTNILFLLPLLRRWLYKHRKGRVEDDTKSTKANISNT